MEEDEEVEKGDPAGAQSGPPRPPPGRSIQHPRRPTRRHPRRELYLLYIPTPNPRVSLSLSLRKEKSGDGARDVKIHSEKRACERVCRSRRLPGMRVPFLLFLPFTCLGFSMEDFEGRKDYSPNRVYGNYFCRRKVAPRSSGGSPKTAPGHFCSSLSLKIHRSREESARKSAFGGDVHLPSTETSLSLSRSLVGGARIPVITVSHE